MKHIQIRKGHDLKIAGPPKKEVSVVKTPEFLVVEPSAIPKIKPKMLVKEGAQVKIGTPLFFDKLNPEVQFTAPGAGQITEISYGERRCIKQIVIKLDSKEESESFTSHSESDITQLKRDQIQAQLLKSGLWTLIRQRPYSKIANPADTPKAIFISAASSAPFSPDTGFILDQNNEGFQSGLNILNQLTGGKIHLVIPHGSDSKVLKAAKNVEISSVSGPHPSGNIGVLVHKIDPINPGEIIWHVNPQDVQTIGQFFLSGNLPLTKTVTVAGPGIETPGYYTFRRGSKINDLLAGQKLQDDVRFIGGNILDGTQKSDISTLGIWDDTLTIIPEGRERIMLGWGRLGFNRYSVSNTFFSKFQKPGSAKLDTLRNGSIRAIVPFGAIESVMPLDIMPTFLIKACLAQDIEEMIALGIHECDPEDFALCSFADVSKMDVMQIIRDGLDLIEAEG